MHSRLPVVLPLALGCAGPEVRDVHVGSGDASRLVITVDEGRIEVVPAPRLRVTRTVSNYRGAVQPATFSEDGTLAFNGSCHGLISCEVEVKVEIPPDLPLQVSLGRGALWATGIERLQADIFSGEADLDIEERLAVTLGRGEVRAWLGPRASANIAVGRGDVSVVVPGLTYGLDVVARDTEVDGVASSKNAPGTLAVFAPAGRARISSGADIAHR